MESFDDDHDDEGEKGVTSLCGMFCFGFILFPAGLLCAGWNERRTACRMKALLNAEDAVQTLDCNDPKGGTGNTGGLSYLQCAIDDETLATFDSGMVAGLAELKNSVVFKGTGMRTTTQVYVCHEECLRTVEGHKDKCEQYRHYLGWSNTFRTTGFKDVKGAMAACGSNKPISKSDMPGYGGAMKNELLIGSHDIHADAGQVKTQQKTFSLNKFQIESIPLNVEAHVEGTEDAKMYCNTQGKAILQQFCALGTFEQSSSQPPSSLSLDNTFTNGTHILTCSSSNLVRGCLAIGFKTSSVRQVAILSSIQEEGKFNEKGWLAPSSFMCTDEYVNHICPDGSCTTPISKDNLIATLKESNDTTAWLYRLVSWACCVIAIFMICSPVTQLLSMASDMVDWIPGIGCLADMLTGAVQAAICCFACSFGTAAFLIVAGFVWVFMRPMWGIPMLLGAIALSAAAAFGGQSLKGKKGGNARDVELSEEEE